VPGEATGRACPHRIVGQDRAEGWAELAGSKFLKPGECVPGQPVVYLRRNLRCKFPAPPLRAESSADDRQLPDSMSTRLRFGNFGKLFTGEKFCLPQLC
jgi:hypothetical protein